MERRPGGARSDCRAPTCPPLPEPRPGAPLRYTFRVTYRRDPEIWRTVELTSMRTLRALHAIMQDAFEFDDDHLYSIFMSGRAWDKASEYAAQPERRERGVSGARLESLRLRLKQRFLYLFDCGDEHEFDVQLESLNPKAPKGRYPRIVEEHGAAPPQYGGIEIVIGASRTRIADPTAKKTPLLAGVFSSGKQALFSLHNKGDPTGDEYAGDIHVLGPLELV